MKTIFVSLLVMFALACSSNKQDESRKIKEIVCGDSIDQELFDQNGNSFFAKVPGPCDTIYETEE